MVKNKKDSSLQNYDNRLKEFLMTTFLVIIVYELIAKVFWSFIFWLVSKCEIQKIWNISIVNPIELGKYVWESFKCWFLRLLDRIPDFLFSSIPWANTNLLITFYSLVTTGLLIWMFYRIAKFIFKHEDIKNYMKWEWRKEFYTDEFWALLLITFWFFWLIILFLYPIFGAFVIFIVLKTIISERKGE